MRRRRATVALVAWTFLVWTTRIANIWRDADLDTGERWGRTLLALSFTILAIAVALGLVRGLRQATVVAVAALATWTLAVWVLRGVGILVADHDLAVVSIALAVLAWRETREPALPTTAAEVPAGRRG
jgi:hypothetical protein